MNDELMIRRQISNLDRLRKLDVLDLHSNVIQEMEGLGSLQDLRVLNLAGNCLRYGRTKNELKSECRGRGCALFPERLAWRGQCQITPYPKRDSEHDCWRYVVQNQF